MITAALVTLLCCQLLAITVTADLGSTSGDPCGICKNGGQLVLTDHSISCSCPSSFTGNLCEKPTLVCKNGGTAVQDSTGVKCQCTADFAGPYCEQGCTNGFTLLKDSSNNPIGCYYFEKTPYNWYDAAASCSRRSGSNLIVVNSETENTAIKSVINSLPADVLGNCNNQFATAGQRLRDGDCQRDEYKYNFYWKVAGSSEDANPIVEGSSFTDWAAYNPNCDQVNGGQSPSESCITFWTEPNAWNDNGCSLPTCSICELPLSQ